MIRVENADTENDMLIRISPKRGSIILEEKQENGIIAYKEVSLSILLTAGTTSTLRMVIPASWLRKP